MKITCPNQDCKSKFEWEPPKEDVVMKMLTTEDLTKPKEKKRYIATCPNCKARISIFL